MADLANHVSLSIASGSVNVPRAGFGSGLILSYSATWVERVREYLKLSDVEADFPNTTSPEYLAAQAYFSQSPRPKKLKIGRGALKPTQKYVLTATLFSDTDYTVTVKGDGFATSELTYTNVGAGSASAIATGLVALLNAVPSKNYLASASSGTVTVTGAAPGKWLSVAVANPAALSVEQTHADPGVATDLSAIALANDDWYGLLTNYNSNAMVLAADAWIQSKKKIYIFDVNETAALTTPAGNSDTLDDIAALTRARTAGAYHHDPAEMFAAAWMGKCFAGEVGSQTWKFKTLSGVTAKGMSATNRANLLARNANFYETVAGNGITVEGTTADGDFIDNQRGLDWLDDDLTKEVFENLIAAGKVPYTDAGVRVITSAVRASLNRGIRKGVLASEPPPVVTAPLVADVGMSDKVARVLPDIEFSATLAGAIHKVFIRGVVQA